MAWWKRDKGARSEEAAEQAARIAAQDARMVEWEEKRLAAVRAEQDAWGGGYVPDEVRALVPEGARVARAEIGENAVELYAYPLPAEQLLPEWQRLRALFPESGWYPILLGESAPTEDYYSLEEPPSDEELEADARADAKAWLVEKLDGTDELPRGKVSFHPDEVEDEGRGPGGLYATARDGYVGLVHSRHSWEVPARLTWYGPANYDIEPRAHTAVLKRWHDLYGAELVVVGPDTLELFASRPPRTREEAIELAIEQYQYCGDLVDQGVGTIDALADVLLTGAPWYFWWD